MIEKDGVQQDVLYWYQAHGRTFASEYLGKFYLAWDGITKGRTDGALIRITAARTPQTFPTLVGFAQERSTGSTAIFAELSDSMDVHCEEDRMKKVKQTLILAMILAASGAIFRRAGAEQCARG